MKIEIPYTPRLIARDIHKNLECHSRSVIVAHRRLGKTVLLINHTIKKATQNELWRPQYAYVFPNLNQGKKVAWNYLKYFTSAFPDVTPNESELYVDFLGGADKNKTRRIYIVGADNPDSMRGNYFDGVIMDEFGQMKPDVLSEIVYPALTDRNGWVVVSGTPKGLNSFYDIYKKARELYNAGDPDWWYTFIDVYHSGIFTPEQIEKFKRDMPENKFRQEFLCDFEASNDDVLIPTATVVAASKREILPADYEDAPLIFGCDVARFGGDSCEIRPRRGLKLYPPLLHAQGIDNMAFADSIAYAIDKYSPDAVFIDAGRGEGVIDRLHRLNYNMVIEVNFGNSAINEARYFNKRTEMWDKMAEWMKKGSIPSDEPELLNDLNTPLFEITPQGKLKLEAKDKIKKRIGRSPDRGDAAALTFAANVRKKSDSDNKLCNTEYNFFPKKNYTNHKQNRYDFFPNRRRP